MALIDNSTSYIPNLRTRQIRMSHIQAYHYCILFKAVAETLAELGADKKYLGATLGFTSILHTWGQNLMHQPKPDRKLFACKKLGGLHEVQGFSPHIHCIVPSGGLNSLGKWVNSRKNFFMPVKVLSSVLRGKFEYYLKRAKLDFYGDEAYLYDDTCFNNFLSSIYNKDWVVYCKPPFKDSSCVVCLNSPPCLAKNILATIL